MKLSDFYLAASQITKDEGALRAVPPIPAHPPNGSSAEENFEYSRKWHCRDKAIEDNQLILFDRANPTPRYVDQCTSYSMYEAYGMARQVFLKLNEGASWHEAPPEEVFIAAREGLRVLFGISYNDELKPVLEIVGSKKHLAKEIHIHVHEIDEWNADNLTNEREKIPGQFLTEIFILITGGPGSVVQWGNKRRRDGSPMIPQNRSWKIVKHKMILMD